MKNTYQEKMDKLIKRKHKLEEGLFTLELRLETVTEKIKKLKKEVDK
jgi:hypothetical protein